MNLDTLKQKEQPEVSVESVTGATAYERVRAFLDDLKETFPNRGALVGPRRELFNERGIVFIASSASNDQGILVGEDEGEGLLYVSLMLTRHSPEAYGVGEKLLDAANARYEIIKLDPYPVNSRENHETNLKLRRIHQNALEHYYEKLGFVKDQTHGMDVMTRRRKRKYL
ncbi:MAG: hypothetical protein NUV88_01435 [Candidatus Kaiserbacteria bacterium]|nr:hypothetical protein [Candidatus Kaiserbacteria bacterium]